MCSGSSVEIFRFVYFSYARTHTLTWCLHEKCIIISLIHTHLVRLYVQICLRALIRFVRFFVIQKSRSRLYELLTCHPLEAFKVHANGTCVCQC